MVQYGGQIYEALKTKKKIIHKLLRRSSRGGVCASEQACSDKGVRGEKLYGEK